MNRNFRLAKILIGITGMVIALFFLTRFSDFTTSLIHYAETNYSGDHSLNPFTRFFFRASYLTFFAILLVVFTLLAIGKLSVTIMQIGGYFYSLVESFIDINKLKKFLLSDDLSGKSNPGVFILWISTIVGLFLHIRFLFNPEPVYESIDEKVSTIALGLALLLVLFAMLFAVRIYSPKIGKTKLFAFLGFLSVALIFVIGEEISWGQRIFNWETPETIKAYNYQDETNLHNFINPILPLIYPLFGMTAFLIMLAYWFFPAVGRSYFIAFIVPSPSFFVLFFFMAASSFMGQGELFESLFSLFCLLYTMRLFVVLRKPALPMSSISA